MTLARFVVGLRWFIIALVFCSLPTLTGCGVEGGPSTVGDIEEPVQPLDFTAEELAQEFSANPDAALEEHQGEQILIGGAVARFIPPTGLQKGGALVLAGYRPEDAAVTPLDVMCYFPEEPKEKPPEGQTAYVRGQIESAGDGYINMIYCGLVAPDKVKVLE